MIGCTHPLLASGDEVAVVMGTVMCMVIASVLIVSHVWRKHREAAYNARLKQLMIERGMSAQEIDVVIRATPDAKNCAAKWTA